MFCEFILFYSSVYLLILSVKNCFRTDTRDNDNDDTEKEILHKKILNVCTIEVYHPDNLYHSCMSECCICLEPYKKRSLIRRMPCRHFFCNDCFQQWIQTTRNPDYPCPLCNCSILGSSESSSL